MRTLKTFQGTHILGASRGLLCDSSAVLSLTAYSTVSLISFVYSDSNVRDVVPQRDGKNALMIPLNDNEGTSLSR